MKSGTDEARGSKKVRVLLVTGASSGGVAEHVGTLAEKLDPAEFEVELAYAERGIGARFGASLNRLEGKGIHLFGLDLRREISPIADVRAFLNLARRLRNEDYDIVHLHSSKAGFLGRWAAALAAKRTVVLYTPHAFAFLNPKNRRRAAFYAVLERVSGPLTDILICTSQSEARAARTHRVAPDDRIQVIENGIDVAAPPTALIEESDSIKVGTVARLAEQKDPLTMVRAADLVLQQGHDVIFEWIGDGPMRPEVERVIAELELGERFVLRGRHPDPPSALSGWDIFVLASRYEGLPYALLEAMAAGLPTVATAVTGNVDVVKQNLTGLLVPPENPAALADAIVRLIQSPERREAMGFAAYERVTSEYTLGGTIERVQKLYRMSTAGMSSVP